MSKPSLRQLAKNGFFGRVTFGMSEAEVEAELGEADFTGGGSRKYRDNLWRYGDLELGFIQSEYMLFHIAINFWGEAKTPVPPEKLDYDPWILRGGLPIEAFISECERQEIEFEELIPPWNDDCREFITEGGMHFIFQVKSDLDEEVPGLTKCVASSNKKEFDK